MAPNMEHDDDLGEPDFSDLKERFEVRMEEGLDSFVVLDGLPKVPKENKDKLIKFLLKRLNTAGRVRIDKANDEQARDEAVFMPVDGKDVTEGYAFVEYETPEQAAAAAKQLDGTAIDKKHTFLVNKLTDIERFGREGRIEEDFAPPQIAPYAERPYLRSWLSDGQARDQFVLFRGDNVGVFWNKKKDNPEPVMERRNWTESFIRWSPSGNYLLSVHRPGIQIWGGDDFKSWMRFPHPNVNLVDFSPNEKYLCTWSNTPIQYVEGHPAITPDDEGKSYIIWEVATGKLLRSFTSIDTPGPTVDEQGNPVKRKVAWPAFKWSADDKFVARHTPGQSLSVYELPAMVLLDKQTIKVEGIVDFEWSPSTPARPDVKGYEQLLCYWTPELGATPAKVTLMSIPSKETVRTRNLFNVTDCKLHWQSDSAYICCKVDRHLTKRGKTVATNLEIFRVKEKGVPVEVIDSVKESVINFAWEPKGNRFVLITTPEAIPGGAPPKTAVLFYAPEKAKGTAVGNFKLVRTVDRKTNNAIYWSPKGRFVVVATTHSQSNFDLDFYDLDFEGEKQESEKDFTANLQLMGTGEHFGVTDVEWDPTGRYVASSSSAWRHTMENGYHLYDFKGTLLREEHIDRFFQFSWRPRPPTLLTKDDQKAIRKNIREFSKQFEEEDQYELDTANMAVVETRRAQLREWLDWREEVELDLAEERRELGLPEDGPTPAGLKNQPDDDGNEEVIEEIVEEVIFEEEEVIS